MNQESEMSHLILNEDDYSLIKELIGSAIYFPRLSQFAAVVEDKLKGTSAWRMLALLEYQESKGCFINHRETGRFGPASLDFYAFNSPIIREIKRRTTSLVRKLQPPVEDSYEIKLVQEGITYVCLAPIVIRERFTGIIVGFSIQPEEVNVRDQHLLEVVAEVIGLVIEKFTLKAKTDKLQKQVRDYRNKLVNMESLKIMGELALGAAHNLNNLLTGILGYVQVISTKAQDPEMKPVISEIHTSVMAGKETIQNLQEFRKMDMDESFDVVHIEEVIKRTVSLTRTKWQDEAWAKNIEYKIEMDLRDPAVVMGNPSTLLEAFIIILFKSLESIPNGGKVTIEIFEDNNQAEMSFLAIKETKITDSLLEMDPFIQYKEGTASYFNLAVAEEIIQRHQGTLSRDTKIGQGTTITVKLPLMEKQAPETINVLPSFEKVSARILVVEDEPIVRSLLRDVLRTEGFTVEAAEDGRAALEILEKDTKFDILITDLGMPVMSGFDLVERARKIISNLPVIMATGWEAQIDRKKVKKYNINYVVGKPFQFRELIESIMICLTQKKKEN
jgi:CheY-like chemotaxis protein/signal transduction histidine kinase